MHKVIYRFYLCSLHHPARPSTGELYNRIAEFKSQNISLLMQDALTVILRQREQNYTMAIRQYHTFDEGYTVEIKGILGYVGINVCYLHSNPFESKEDSKEFELIDLGLIENTRYLLKRNELLLSNDKIKLISDALSYKQ